MKGSWDKARKAIWLLPLFFLAIFYLLWKGSVRTGSQVLLAELLIFIGYLAALWDIKEQRVPNKLMLVFAACWFLVVIPQLLVSPDAAMALVRKAIGGFFMGGGMMMAAYLASKKGLGGGDVKFVAIAGCYVGYGNILSGVLFGSILSAASSLALILMKKAKKTDMFPFVPFLYIGIMLAEFLS